VKDADVTARETAALPATFPLAGRTPVLHRAFAAFLAWQDHRRSLAALSRLDDRLLRDVGLARRPARAKAPHETF
jgi:uncharacterized protein YjiS (DUF1127 family)